METDPVELVYGEPDPEVLAKWIVGTFASEDDVREFLEELSSYVEAELLTRGTQTSPD